MTKPAFTSIRGVAEHCDVSDRTVRRWLEAGLRHYKLDPSQQARVLIRWSDLEAWLDAHAR